MTKEDRNDTPEADDPVELPEETLADLSSEDDVKGGGQTWTHYRDTATACQGCDLTK